MEQIIVNKIEGQIEILSYRNVRVVDLLSIHLKIIAVTCIVGLGKLVFILTLLAKNYWKVKKLMKIFLIENES
jgi:hypothetical protein